MGLPYMPTLAPLAPPQLIGIYTNPMERLGKGHVPQITGTHRGSAQSYPFSH